MNKPKKWVLLLSGILLLAYATAVVSATKEFKADVVWDPGFFELDMATPEPWNARVSLQGQGHDARVLIDPATIKLEGTYSPCAPPYPATWGPVLIVPFSGSQVLVTLYSKLEDVYTGPGIYDIPLEVTGNLKPEYGGNAFQGTGIITVYPAAPPPPPPPPPP